jgi:hypothetical protein
MESFLWHISQQISVIGPYDEQFHFNGLNNIQIMGRTPVYVNKHRTTMF